MKEDVQRVVAESLRIIKRENDFVSPPAEIEITVPKRREFGDFSTNIALILAGELKKKPGAGVVIEREGSWGTAREVAELIIENLPQEGKNLFKKVEIAGPGFINFFIKEEAITNKLTETEKLADTFGNSNLGSGEKVLVEFVSANPTGYLHMGHARNAAVGDAISNILTAVGFDVTREFYINDAGRQVELLGLSVYRRYEELFGIKKEMPEDGYRGEYIKEIAAEIKEKRGRDLLVEEPLQQESIQYCKEYAKNRLLEEMKKDLRDFGVTFDNWYSEQDEIHNPLPELAGRNRLGVIINKLRLRDALEERDGALWFRASNFGDSQDWVIVKRDGSSTYFLSDIGYHYDKIQRGFKRLINVWGADHHGHVTRLRAALRALGFNDSWESEVSPIQSGIQREDFRKPSGSGVAIQREDFGEPSLDVVLIQFVRLMREGQEISMSKRAGSYVTMREVMEEVGRDVMRFFLLMRGSESHLDFDLDLAKKESSENPVYYIQYAHARIGSVFEKAREKELFPSKEFLNLLDLPEEIEIIKKLLLFPEVVRESALSLSPHKIAFYLQDIASDFHIYYNKNRILGDDPKLSAARLYFIHCIRIVIRNGLKLLGVSAPQRM